MNQNRNEIWNNQNIRNAILQIILLICIVLLIYYLSTHLQKNLKERGIAAGFAFLDHRAGFNIIMHLIDYSEKSTYLKAFWVGVVNTLLVSVISIFVASFIGVIIGIARLSTNWLWSKIALGYVEIIRNIPLLIQLFFWYFVVLRAAPYPEQAIHFKNIIFFTNRGLYLPKPLLDSTSIGLIACAIVGMILIYSLRKNSSLFLRLKIFAAFVLTVMLFLGIGLSSWELPVLGRFNFEKGIVLIPEFMALGIGLSIYTSAFIAEIVRMGILSIPKGQTEAALSLGLTKRQTLKLIILPQALRVIIPPLTNQYLNLTKNSSLAAAIAYPDLVSVFAGTVLNQTGQAVEVIAMTMAVYLTISLSISGIMLLYERNNKW